MPKSTRSSSDHPADDNEKKPSPVDPILAALDRRNAPIHKEVRDWGAWSRVRMVDLESQFDTAEHIVEAWVKRLCALEGVDRLDVIDLVDQRQPFLPSSKEVLRHLRVRLDIDGAVASLKAYEAHPAYGDIRDELAVVIWSHITNELGTMERITEAYARADHAVATVLEGRPPVGRKAPPSTDKTLVTSAGDVTEVPPAAPCPSTGSVACGNALAQRGAVWEITYNGKQTLIGDRKGMHYLKVLLAHPGQSLSVEELAIPDPSERHAPVSAQEVFDEESLRQCSARLEAIQEEREVAQTDNDEGRVAALDLEREQISELVGTQLGRGGEARKFTSMAERLRFQVGDGLDACITEITKFDPELGKHLRTSIRPLRGVRPRYEPQPPVMWLISGS